MAIKAKKIDIVVINDLVTDNRVHKVALSLLKMGFYPRLIGRRKRNSLPIDLRKYPTCRMRLIFETGPLFYVEFNIRLFFKLLFSRAEIILSNDLDTLAASFFASKLSGKKLVYDSHEYFTEVPELVHRPFKQKIWQKLEKFILPRIKNAITVSQSIADEYSKQYGTPFKVIRNLPFRNRAPESLKNSTIIPLDEKIVIYQGALNLGRGLECAIQAMRFTQGIQLWLVGSGDLDDHLKVLTRKSGVQFKVRFFGQVPFDELAQLTAQADLGLSIEEDLGLNYRYALPNKLFDYIQHSVPVLVSSLPEMARIVQKYEIGQILSKHQPEELAVQITKIMNDQDLLTRYHKNLKIAAEELCWENELPVLRNIFENIN